MAKDGSGLSRKQVTAYRRKHFAAQRRTVARNVRYGAFSGTIRRNDAKRARWQLDLLHQFAQLRVATMNMAPELTLEETRQLAKAAGLKDVSGLIPQLPMIVDHVDDHWRGRFDQGPLSHAEISRLIEETVSKQITELIATGKLHGPSTSAVSNGPGVGRRVTAKNGSTWPRTERAFFVLVVHSVAWLVFYWAFALGAHNKPSVDDMADSYQTHLQAAVVSWLAVEGLKQVETRRSDDSEPPEIWG